MIEGEVEVLEIDSLPQERGDRLAARTGFDPRAQAIRYRWLRVSPRRVQARRAAGGPDSTGRSAGEPRRLEAGQIEPGDADGDREGGPA